MLPTRVKRLLRRWQAMMFHGVQLDPRRSRRAFFGIEKLRLGLNGGLGPISNNDNGQNGKSRKLPACILVDIPLRGLENVFRRK